MGFVAILKLLAKVFDIFAWPLITLVYPVYASIRAVENNSNADNRKWLTYWVLYALIVIFELASEIVIQWLPFWSYMKLIATCWLVAPHFDGTTYVYEHIVRPCFSVNPLIWLLGFFLCRSDEFLVAAQKYMKENGSEALEELIINKTKCVEPNLTVTENKAVAAKENKRVAALEGVGTEDIAVAAKENKVVVASENKAVATKNKRLVALEGIGIENIAMAAKEWKGVVAKESKGVAALEGVGTENKAVAAKENKGIAASEGQGIKNKTVATKESKGVMAMEGVKCSEPILSRTVEKTFAAIESKAMTAVAAEHRGIEIYKVHYLKTGQSKWTCALCEVSGTCDLVLKDHLQGKKHQAKKEKLNTSQMADKNKDDSVSIQGKADQSQKVWTCALCQVSTPSEAVLNDHFQGKKHKAKEGMLKASNMADKDKDGSVSTQKKNDSPTMATKKDISTNEPGPENVVRQENKKVQTNVNAEQLVQKYQKKSEDGESVLWCDKCNIWCHSEIVMASHLNGKKHLAKLNKQA